MKEGWEIKKLGDYFDIGSSKRVFKSEWQKQGVPFYRAREIVKLSKDGYVNNELFITESLYSEYSQKYGIPKEGDILVTGVGTLGICYAVRSTDKFYYKDGNIICLHKVKDIVTKYVIYAFKSSFVRSQVESNEGAVVGTYTIERAKQTQIPVPSLLEQERIVGVLDREFERIDALKANAEQSLQAAKDLFQAELKKIFSLKEGWEIKQVSELADTGAGGTPLKIHKDYYEGGTIPWLRSGEVCCKDILSSEMYITQKGLDNSSAKYFPENTVLVAMYGATAGQVGILRFPATTNQAICGILPNSSYIPEYLYYAMLSKKDELVAQAVGGAQPNISQIKIKNTQIPIPPLSEQQAIVERLDAVSKTCKEIENNSKEIITQCEALKQSLLRMAFNGEL